MLDSIRQFVNLALIFIALVATTYITRMLLRYVWQRMRFLYGKKPKSATPPIVAPSPPPLPKSAPEHLDPPT